jgi:DNA-damage-inducible protein J
MGYMTTIQVRTDEKTKKAAQRMLQKLGMDLSTAINMYLVQIVLQKGIPFPVLTENGMTEKTEKRLLREIANTKKNGKRYASAKEMHRDILGA